MQRYKNKKTSKFFNRIPRRFLRKAQMAFLSFQLNLKKQSLILLILKTSTNFSYQCYP